MQNEWAGAWAFSSFDTYLAPFVHKYKIELEQELDELHVQFPTPEERKSYIDQRTHKYVTQQMQNFIFGLNVSITLGNTNSIYQYYIDTGDTIQRISKKKSLMLWGIEHGYYPKKFSELEDEMKLINRVLIDLYQRENGQELVFTFPIPTYNITEDFPWNDPDVNLLFEMTAKYGIPYSKTSFDHNSKL